MVQIDSQWQINHESLRGANFGASTCKEGGRLLGSFISMNPAHDILELVPDLLSCRNGLTRSCSTSFLTADVGQSTEAIGAFSLP